MFFNHRQEVINQFPEGDLLMTNSHRVAKHFSYASTNRKNHNNTLKSHVFYRPISSNRITMEQELLLCTKYSDPP